ncbi:polymorphic toxin type 50 domain-containing protein [Pseudomonas sp.]
MGQQGKHIKGHNNFEEGRSYLGEIGVRPRFAFMEFL